MIESMVTQSALSLEDVLYQSQPAYAHVDEYWMGRCLQLAERARGATSPNPVVGAVVVDAQGQFVSEGWHQRPGGPHAEAMALANSGNRAKGGTIYVSLEPCNHTGKTPPCSQAILDAGIGRVVYGCRDTNPRVDGGGGESLAKKGLTVVGGVLERACEQSNEAFFYAQHHQRPFITVKLALTADGCVNTRSSKGAWLTSPMSRQWAHQLRAQHDAILTTAESIVADDSQLTVREGLIQEQQPLRVVLDRRGRLRERTHRLFCMRPEGHINPSPVVHVVSDALQSTWPPDGDAPGIETLFVPEWGEGLCLKTVLKRLYTQHHCLNVMVEAGPRLVSRMLHQHLVNKLYLAYTPHWVMDSGASRASVGEVCLQLDQAPTLQVVHRQTIEHDQWITAYPKYL